VKSMQSLSEPNPTNFERGIDWLRETISVGTSPRPDFKFFSTSTPFSGFQYIKF
jgi:hypothetical protein